MPDEEQPQNNYDRLLNHIKQDSLAAQLVRAYCGPEAESPTEAMKAVLRERLTKLREKIDIPET